MSDLVAYFRPNYFASSTGYDARMIRETVKRKVVVAETYAKIRERNFSRAHGPNS
jgi:hypothetical protein